MQVLEKAMAEAAWTGKADADAPVEPAKPLVMGNTSPSFLPKRAEAFLPWSLPGQSLCVQLRLG